MRIAPKQTLIRIIPIILIPNERALYSYKLQINLLGNHTFCVLPSQKIFPRLRQIILSKLSKFFAKEIAYNVAQVLIRPGAICVWAKFVVHDSRLVPRVFFPPQKTTFTNFNSSGIEDELGN